MKRADVAMYVAKRVGGGCMIYAPELDEHSPNRLALPGRATRSDRRRQLVLHYQPKFDVATLELVGVEALVRWQHPKLGLLPPDQFITLADGPGSSHA